MRRYVHGEISPVQSFVAQSPRTRDLWASSYLLSFLAARTMRAVVHAGGAIVSPWLEGNALWAWTAAPERDLPKTGSVPNRFTIEVGADCDACEIAKAAEQGFYAAWSGICGAVWREYLAASRAETKAIWDRQVAGFWELT